jgi:hypothetical protein
MQADNTNYLPKVNQFLDAFWYDGEVKNKEPKKTLEGFQYGLEALGGLSSFDHDADELKKVREKLKARFKDKIAFENVEGQNDRVMLVREFAKVVIYQADQCAQVPEWQVTKRTIVKDAGKKIASVGEVAVGAGISVAFSVPFWIGTAISGNGFKPKYNLLQVPGMVGMAGVIDGFERLTRPTAVTVKHIGEEIQEIKKVAEQFAQAQLAPVEEKTE